MKPPNGYLLAVLGTAAMVLLRLVLNRSWGPDVPLLLFVLPVLAAAGAGGLRPGLAASVLGGVAGTFLFLHPAPAQAFVTAEKVFWLGVFLFIGVLISTTCESLHRRLREKQTAEDAAREAYGALEAQVQVTGDLERRWLQLLRANVIGTAVGDHEGRVIDANDILLDMLGYTRAELEAGSIDWLALTPPEHRAATSEALQAVRSHGVSSVYEKEYLSKAGARVPVLLRLVRAPDEPRHMIAFVVDLRRQREAEGALRQEAARQDLLVDAIRDYAIITLDPHGVIASWNAGAERINGYAPSEVLGRHLSVLYPQTDDAAAKVDAELKRALRDGRVEDEGWRVRKGGDRYWANVLVTPIRDEGNLLLGFAKITRDLTDRRQSEVLLQSVLDNVLDAIIGIDERGTVQSFNRAAERIFGFREHEVRGRNVSMLMPDPDRSAHDTYLHNYLTTGHAKIIGIGRQLLAKRRDGTCFPAELTVSEFALDGRRYFTGSIRDVTAQRRLEEQLRQSQKMEAIGRLAGGVAHDFNNLLTVIVGYAAFLREDAPPGSDAVDMLAAIVDASEHASRLTRQLLVFSRQAVVEPQVLELDAVVAETEKMLCRVIGEDIVLETALASDTPAVFADPGQISQVLMNLAVNARDAMPRGGRLTLETRRARLDERRVEPLGDVAPGEYTLLSVSDTGHGMSEDVRARAFEPFFTTKGPGEGTGLGLSTVYGIVKQAGGHVELYSEVEIGTVVKVYLPAVDVAGHTVPPPKTADIRGGTEVVLIVEDDRRVRDVARLALTSQGYQVITAPAGADALEILAERQGRVDLVVTDVVMPGMSGRELADICRDLYHGLRVLYVSGYTDDAVVRHGLLHNEVEFLQKPYTPDSLAARVRQVLDEIPPADG